MPEQLAYFEDIIGRRRAEPRDDLISVLAEAEAEHDDFSPSELNLLCFLLLGAGSETTRNLIAHGLVGLTRYPGPASRRSCVKGATWGAQLRNCCAG
jgi:cytochrome P450